MAAKIKIMALNDATEPIVLGALKSFAALLKGQQSARVAFREINLREDNMVAVRQIEETMGVSDRQLEITQSLIKQIEEA